MLTFDIILIQMLLNTFTILAFVHRNFPVILHKKLDDHTT